MVVDDVVHTARGSTLERSHSRGDRIVQVNVGELSTVVAEARESSSANTGDQLVGCRVAGSVEQAVSQHDAVNRPAPGCFEDLEFHGSHGFGRIIELRI